jgi:hypothetical protein
MRNSYFLLSGTNTRIGTKQRARLCPKKSEANTMARFTLPRDLYHGKGSLEALKTFDGKRGFLCVGGWSMKRFGFLDRRVFLPEEAAWRSSCSRA